MMQQAETWGWLLIAAALVSLGLQVVHWRRGRVTTAQAATAVLARSGFLFLGVVYVFRLNVLWPRTPFIGLAIVGVGIFLHLTVNVIQNLMRGRGEPIHESDEPIPDAGEQLPEYAEPVRNPGRRPE